MEAADADVTSPQKSTKGGAARQRVVGTTDAFFLYLPNPTDRGGETASRFVTL